MMGGLWYRVLKARYGEVEGRLTDGGRGVRFGGGHCAGSVMVRVLVGGLMIMSGGLWVMEGTRYSSMTHGWGILL